MICRHCQEHFPTRIKINGVTKTLQNRKFCLKCSPYGSKNTKPSLVVNLNIVSETERRCADCKIVKPIDNFYVRKNRGDYYHYCKECANNETIKRYRQNKLNAVNYKGGKCIKCGYDKCIDCLEFHHTNPTLKDFTISHHKGKILESIKNELDKCILLCKNCHGEEHFNLRFSNADLVY